MGKVHGSLARAGKVKSQVNIASDRAEEDGKERGRDGWREVGAPAAHPSSVCLRAHRRARMQARRGEERAGGVWWRDTGHELTFQTPKVEKQEKKKSPKGRASE
jgi:ribosomal protein S30